MNHSNRQQILSHNSDIFLAILSLHLIILTFFLRIAWYKLTVLTFFLRIARYKLAVLTFFLRIVRYTHNCKLWSPVYKRQIFSQNCKFISHSSDFISRNFEFIFHNWEFVTQFGEKTQNYEFISSNSGFITHNCKLISYNSGKKVRITFFNFFYSWRKRAFIVNQSDLWLGNWIKSRMNHSGKRFVEKILVNKKILNRACHFWISFLKPHFLSIVIPGISTLFKLSPRQKEIWV